MKLMNRLGNRLFSMVISKLTKKKISDTTTGFRAFNRKVAEGIKIINNFTYTQEQIIKAVKSGKKDIVELLIDNGADINYVCKNGKENRKKDNF